MGEELIDREVVVAPREMRSSSWLLSCTSRTCNGIDCNVVDEHTSLCEWEKTKLDASGEAAWVGKVLALCCLFAVDFRESIHVVVVALDAEVLCQVHNLHAGRDVMLLKELLALAMTEAEEYDVNIVERHFARELEVGLADESFVNVIDIVACVRLRVGKDYLCLWMIEQKADEFTASIAGSTEDADADRGISHIMDLRFLPRRKRRGRV